MATSWSERMGFVPFAGPAPPEPQFRVLESSASAAKQFQAQTGDHDPASHRGERSEAELRAEITTELRSELEAEFRTRFEAEDEHLREIVATLMATREHNLDACARNAAVLAIAAARRILHREIAADPDALVAPLRAALARANDARELRLRAHPEDAARLRANPGLLTELRITRVEEDRGLARGDALVEADDRAVDLCIESQLEEIGEAIEAALGSADA